MKYDAMNKGHGKSRWKTLMIFNDAIFVQAKKGGEDNNVKGINTPEVDDCLCGCIMFDDVLILLLLRINNHN